MNGDEYISTGDAARMLNISRSTVSRKFDAGELPGRLNPITHERSLSLRGLVKFMESHGIPTTTLSPTRKILLLASHDPGLRKDLRLLAETDRRLEVVPVDFGADAIVLCLKKAPELLIVGDDLPDLSPASLIDSLKRHEIAAKTRILCSLREGAVPEPAVAERADAIVTTTGDYRAELQQRVYDLLDIPESPSPANGRTGHLRRWPRLDLSMACRATLYAQSRPRHRIAGTAQLRNISRGGAYIARIAFSESIPAKPFRMDIELDSPQLPNWSARCKVVRLESNGQLSAGLRFLNISKSDVQKIVALENR